MTSVSNMSSDELFAHNEELKKQVGNKPIKESICVDGSCLGNPGMMQYRLINFKTNEHIFTSREFKKGTNIIAEFLAIVHGLIWLDKNKLSNWVIYSDCFAAIQWAKHKRVNTTLESNADTRETLEAMVKAVNWLNHNHYDPETILKWDTENWGEIPADFGRK